MGQGEGEQNRIENQDAQKGERGDPRFVAASAGKVYGHSRRRTLLWSIFIDALRDNFGKVLVSLGALLLGSIGFFLTPVKDLVLHRIWGEAAEILIIPTSGSVTEGERLGLKVTVVPKSPIGISEGVARVEFDHRYLTLVQGSPSITTPTIKGPWSIPAESEWIFLAVAPGSTLVSVHLSSKYQTFTANRSLVLEGAASRTRPSEGNFSGGWKMRFGFNNGGMDILDKRGSLSGRYYVATGEQGVIDGLRDGEDFLVDFIRGGEHRSKWHIAAKWQRRGDFLEIKGKALLLVIDKDGWSPRGTQAEFYATAHR